MTRDDIVRMAREAGWTEYSLLTPVEVKRLERFADLVAAAEREACAEICDANAAACRNNSMLHDVLAGNAAAIRVRGQHE